ncbi:MAG: DUF2271 domain-containing protein [Paracoccaceae bacterium]|nr:DUF2271 domain-containing protein [Paracoccaceae bacterium]MDG1737196.1 DUF2271 domain-containing protein [Paracoccaceae bacterium]MDG2257015.1 DUF2271 domain-containing protein [Paracoccaceae bacterium]
MIRRKQMLAVVTALALAAPGLTQAKTLTITTKLGKVAGPKAYVAIYITDPKGRVFDTLHVAGRKSKYQDHLRGWMRGARSSRTKAHAVTGASVGSRAILTASVEIADNLIAAGYQVRVDTAREDHGDISKAAVLTLGKENSVKGKGIVRSVEVK